jgi:hypothetical protein
MNVLSLPVSFGEAADQLSILEIKRERIGDPAKRVSVEARRHLVAQVLGEQAGTVAGFSPLFDRLKAINERLWDIEEDIRAHERKGDFGDAFVQLARAVYQTNDERSRVKREIDLLFGSPILEEKSYVDHDKGEAEG